MRWSKRLKAKIDINVNGLKQLLGIQIIVGIYKFSRIKMYWDSHASVSKISQTMSLHRFYQLHSKNKLLTVKRFPSLVKNFFYSKLA